MNIIARAPFSATLTVAIAVVLAASGSCVHLAQSAPKSQLVELPETMRPPPPRPTDHPDRRDVSIAAPLARQAMPRPDTAEIMPDEERACRSRLEALGVKFSAQPRIEDEGGCGIAFPIEVSSLASDVELTPRALMNCGTAETAALLARDVIEPATRRQLGAGLTGIRQASAYVCRVRGGGTKISEHARGNALDISAFLLDDGRQIDVQAYGPADKPERLFMRAIRGKACGPFKTVLGPGTNADHTTHLHLDLAERRRGGTYCH